jgi:hypothetical protein
MIFPSAMRALAAGQFPTGSVDVHEQKRPYLFPLHLATLALIIKHHGRMIMLQLWCSGNTASRFERMD